MLATILSHPIAWLLNNGVGQNITAGILAFAAGVVWSRTKGWPLARIHARLDALHTSHQRLHSSHEVINRKLDLLASEPRRGAPAPPPRPPASGSGRRR